MDELRDEFPIGMSVLAVDDDRICLKILETLLKKCQYHVTTATNAIMALNLLRKNKKKFDLVISNVHMPDMDGFKLLELIGLEMDLPVIMLSANDDPKMVMKGISHGACDYLLKPVRIEELKNIWQHVIRKKKITTKIRNQQDTPNSDSCNGLNSAVTTNENQNEKSSKKRKEHSHDNDDDDDDDDGDVEEHENGLDNEDTTAHKKPRVVWSVELHRKFLAAVNQLGVDRAVPKKILDLMNVENLTRENVASHLQKYRLYLKRNSCAENQHANNMVPAFGNTNQSYLRMRSVSEIGNLQTLNGSRQFHNNNAFNVNVHGLPSSGTLQLIQQQNLSNSTHDQQLQFQSTVIRANPNAVQGMPISVSPMQNFTNKLSDYRSKVAMGCTASPFLDTPNNALMLEPKVVGSYKNLASQSHHSQFSPSLLDNGMCNNDIWSHTMKSPMMNSLTNINSEVVTNNVSLQGWINHNQDVKGGSIVSSSISANAGGELGGLNFSFGEPLGMNQLKSQNSGLSSSFGSLEDILISKQKSDNMKFLDGYVFDNYSGGKSM